MTTPGWYRDPAEPDVRRYWDGEQWIGDGVPADAPVPTDPPKDGTPRYGGDTATKVDLSKPVVETDAPFPGWGGATGGGWGARPEDTERRPGYPVTPGYPPAGPNPPLGTLPGDVPAEQLAGLGTRLAARLLDILFVALLNVVVNGWFIYQYAQQITPLYQAYVRALETGDMSGLPSSAERATSDTSWLNLIITLIALGLWFAYEVPAVWNSGQTLGKRIMGIRVQFLLGQQMTFRISMVRWWVQALTLICSIVGPIIGLVDALWCLGDRPRRQCLHDKAVATIVVRKDARRPDEGEAR
ncbi:RDD family protein [Fodinicola acaciae]|uniref:RDD family protein n=1 Tax=Fodinicola acaciae TaxID=2681555 RepID=UPI0013D83854|nr:RDD family protein [Fodinicola acaciae]